MKRRTRIDGEARVRERRSITKEDHQEVLNPVEETIKCFHLRFLTEIDGSATAV